MKARDAVDFGAEIKGEDGHAEILLLIARVFAAECEEIVEGIADIVGESFEVFAHHGGREAIVTGGDGSVCGEDGRGADGVDCGIASAALEHEAAQSFEGAEGGVSFVQVKERGIDAKCLKSEHAADAEKDFLSDAIVAITAVEVVGECAVVGSVIGDAGVEEKEGDAADLSFPDTCVDDAVADGDGDGFSGVDESGEGGIEMVVCDGGGAVGEEALSVVAISIEEADADEGNPEVRSGLEVVAGEDAETAGVEGE